MCQVISRFMDEHSMLGQAYRNWMRHTHEELKSQRQVLYGDGDEFHIESHYRLQTIFF